MVPPLRHNRRPRHHAHRLRIQLHLNNKRYASLGFYDPMRRPNVSILPESTL